MRAMTEKSRGLPGGFEALVREHPPYALRDEVAYGQALGLMDRLVAIAAPMEGQLRYMELLADLIRVYEMEHHSLDDKGLTPVEALKFLMEQNGMRPVDLAALLGKDKSLATRILDGERELTTAHIRVLAERFKVSPALFVA